MIDCLGAEYSSSINYERGTLYACSLVCHAWLHRARLRLYAKIDLSSTTISRFQSTLSNNPGPLSTFVKEMNIWPDHGYSLSATLVRHRLKNLTTLQLGHVEFAREHTLLSRSLLARPVRTLRLYDVKSCSVAQLARFVNLFHSLTSLTISFKVAKLEHKGERLPPTNRPTGPSLTFLRLWLIPGINIFIDWCTQMNTGRFLVGLKTLYLVWRMLPPESDFHAYIDGMRFALVKCAQSLEDLALIFHVVSMKDEISNICTSYSATSTGTNIFNYSSYAFILLQFTQDYVAWLYNEHIPIRCQAAE